MPGGCIFRKGKPLVSFIGNAQKYFSISTLQIMPSFPHTVINYNAGIEHLSLRIFLRSEDLGLTIKNTLYINAISGCSETIKMNTY